MTNLTARNKGALVHRKRRMSVPPLEPSFKHTLSPPKQSKLLRLLLLLPEDPNSLRTHQIDAVKGRNGGGGGGGGRARGLTSLNRPHSGGGQLVWDRFPCSQQLHFHKPRGGKRQRESEEEGQRQKDREGARRGNDRDEKKKKGKKERESAHTQRGEKAGAPKHQRLLRARNEGVTQ